MSTLNGISGRATSGYILYQYTPSLVAAAIAVAVFTILTGAHFFRMFKAKTWFCIPFVIGGVFELIGYIGRALGHSNKQSKTAYIMQSVLILVAPALFAATIYMTLGRLMRAAHSEKYSIIPARWLTKIFVIGDVLSFFIQGGGGGIMASGDPDKIRTGENIILGGLFFQVIIFGLFILAAIILHTRMRKYPTPKSCQPDLKWERMLIVLYTVSGLILFRNIIRIVEYLGGRQGPMLRVEWPIYIFDGLLMAATMAVFFIGYPTLIQPRNSDNEMDVGVRSAESTGASPRFKR